MIRQLTLTNWRSYENVTIPFGPGTTFVVASNGIGKSSLLEALRWALFGKIARSGDAAIRVGADSATAAVELELPDGRSLWVERVLPRRKQDVTPTVQLDGMTLVPEQLERELVGAYRTEPTFLSNLTVPEVGADQGSAARLDFADQLGRYYGIDSLSEAVARLDALRKKVQAEVRQIKVANAVSAKHLDNLRAAADRATKDVAAAMAEHRAAQDRLSRAQERDRAEAAFDAWARERAAWFEAATKLTHSIAEATGLHVSVEDAESVLDKCLTDIDQQLEAVRVEIAVAIEQEISFRRNDERLGEAHDDCPVCRRPLDESTIAAAHRTNQHEIDATRETIRRQRKTEGEIGAHRERLTAIRSNWWQLRRPGEQPPSPVGDGEVIDSAELDALSRAKLDALVDARTKQAQVNDELAQAQQADEAMRRLETLFRQEATITVALRATEATRAELLDETVRPLATELNQRWKGLFPDRGDLNTRGNGDITRSVGSHQLPFDSFSTGESMGAAVIVRLLAAQMATGADFCWFDEPLEHLDPHVRRQVANLLSRAASGEGQLRQVVVTTYEEQLARHLHTRDARHVHLMDVRPAS